jgi:hypothetical protein
MHMQTTIKTPFFLLTRGSYKMDLNTEKAQNEARYVSAAVLHEHALWQLATAGNFHLLQYFDICSVNVSLKQHLSHNFAYFLWNWFNL